MVLLGLGFRSEREKLSILRCLHWRIKQMKSVHPGRHALSLREVNEHCLVRMYCREIDQMKAVCCVFDTALE